MYKTAFDILAKSAEIYPHKLALKDRQSSLRYEEFYKHSLALASKIAKLDLYSKSVLIISQKSCEAVVAMFGVWASANYFSFLPLNHPPKRVQRIIAKLKPSLIIAQKDLYLQYKTLLNETLTPPPPQFSLMS